MAQKKTFEFRMSKKVAELTQVVHMLFTRNHEKEVEIEALKDAYEVEIELVIKDAKSRIERLEYQIRDISRKSTASDEKVTDKLREEFSRKEKEWAEKLAKMENLMTEEKRECQSIRDLLINAQRDMEALKREKGAELSKRLAEFEMKNQENMRLHALVADLEKKLRDSDQHSYSALGELQRSYDKLRKEYIQTRDTLQDTDKLKDQLALRNKRLDSEIKSLRKELAKRSSLVKPKNTTSEPRVPVSGYEDYNEEIERLRKEVQRYRMELYNRENNFNRMFTEKSPVFVDGRLTRLGVKQAETGSMPHVRYPRQKTPVQDGRRNIIGSFSQAEEDLRHSAEFIHTRDISDPKSRASSASSISVDHLPQLGMDFRRHSGHLVKPRPLPKELLSPKEVGKA